MKKIKVGLIGYGRLGGFYLDAMSRYDQYQLVAICDICPEAREYACNKYPDILVTDNEDLVINHPEINLVILSALADSRGAQIRKAVAQGKHIIAEKPIGLTVEEETELVQLVEQSNVLFTPNMYLNNSWYHGVMKEFVKSGEIGELAIIRVCHLTPGLAPGEGHEVEGPAFHDCGMHYVNIARWHAESEYRTWRAQAVRMWSYKDPWWLQCQGTFENGITFDITQGHNYGQLSKNQSHNSYCELLGTKGVVRMTHDFHTAVVELLGVTRTERIERPYGGKNISVLLERMAWSIEHGTLQPSLPTAHDAAEASRMAWEMLSDAATHDMPAIGTQAELDQIHERRRTQTNGYGLLSQRRKCKEKGS